jgi:hypothetical protein
MNADGSGQTRLTDNNAQDFEPSWSPDGTKIAFTSDRDGNYQIYVMNADGSGQTRLTDTGGNSYPSWSPDGTKIAFESTRDGNGEIYVMNADGSGQTRLTDNNAQDAHPSWSPDGTKIAFFSDRNDDFGEIYVMNADGSGQTNVSNNPGQDIEPDWGTNTSPAGGGGGTGDTTPPVLTVPDDFAVEATSGEQGAEVTYTVTAQDDVDGNATLEEDNTVTQEDNIGGDIDISCDPPPGSTFPIGDTVVECTATDAAGNVGGPASFTVTVNAPPTPAEAIEELTSTVEELEDVPQSVKTSLTAPLGRASNILTDDNPNNDIAVCGMLTAFINQVNAYERRDMLTEEQANELRMQADDIRNELNC